MSYFDPDNKRDHRERLARWREPFLQWTKKVEEATGRPWWKTEGQESAFTAGAEAASEALKAQEQVIREQIVTELRERAEKMTRSITATPAQRHAWFDAAEFVRHNGEDTQ